MGETREKERHLSRSFGGVSVMEMEIPAGMAEREPRWSEEDGKLTVELDPRKKEEGLDAVFTVAGKGRRASVALPLMVVTGAMAKALRLVGKEMGEERGDFYAEFTMGRQMKGAGSVTLMRFSPVVLQKDETHSAFLLNVTMVETGAIDADGRRSTLLSERTLTGVTLSPAQASEFFMWAEANMSSASREREAAGWSPSPVTDGHLVVSGPEIRTL